jgi:hypothetical protein
MRQLGRGWHDGAGDSQETKTFITDGKGLGGLETGALFGIADPDDGHPSKHPRFDSTEPAQAIGLDELDYARFSSVSLPKNFKFVFEPAVVSRQVSAYFQDKSTNQNTPIVVTATVQLDWAKAERANDPDLVELKLQTSIEKTPPEKAAGAKASRAGKAKEAPAGIKAIAELVVDEATESLLESLKEGLPDADDKLHLILTADALDDLNKQLHQFFGNSVARAMNVAGLPPELAAFGGGITEHAEFSHDDWVEEKVKALRVAGITIDILSGGLPVAEVLDFLFDSLQEGFGEQSLRGADAAVPALGGSG